MWADMKKAVKILLAALLTVVLMAVFYLAVILGQPQKDPDAVVVAQDQPLLTASPAVTLTSAGELEGLLRAFPVAALYAADTSWLNLTGGTSYDLAYGSGFARVLALNYTTTTGERVEVQSIYPARALEFVKRGDYRLSNALGQSLGGLQSVRMESGTSIRLHVQAAEGIYVLTVPAMTDEELTDITRALQLYAVPEEADT